MGTARPGTWLIGVGGGRICEGAILLARLEYRVRSGVVAEAAARGEGESESMDILCDVLGAI